MKLHWLLVIFIGLVLNSCMWGVPKKKETENGKRDTMAYDYKTSKENDYTTSYPVFAKDTLLNRLIDDTIRAIYPAAKGIQSQFQIAENKFVRDTTNAKKASSVPLRNIKVRVIRQDSSVVTIIVIDSISNTAGSINLMRFINWSISEKKMISLDDIVSDKEKLTAIAEQDFRKEEKLDSTESLNTNYFFKDGKFALTNNFLITPLGLRFLYNVYEIKPLAAGQTELLLPYTQIQSLIKPNSVAAQYIKHAGF